MFDASTAAEPQPSSGERLESWKAIAAYLGRDVSTVRRWEKVEGLPVHRHQHAARGSAYAYKSELNRWFESRRADLDGPRSTAPAALDEAEERSEGAAAHVAAIASEATGSRRRGALLVAVAGVAMAVVLSAIYIRTQPAASSSFRPRDWILVGQIENRTGDPRLNDTIQYALERELSESSFVTVVSRERIADTLRLMKRPADASLDRQTGLEVCRRDSGIRAMLTGRVEKLGSIYVVSAMVLDPNESERTIAAADARAADDSRILDAVHAVSDRIRQALGEDSRSVRSVPLRLERVTTPSLEALELYTQGIGAVNQQKWRVGAEFLQRAVSMDPNFAAARIYLAWCLMGIGRPADEYLSHAREAARLAEHQSDREQYFILASYHEMTGELEKAVGLYEAALKLYPDHFWAANNLDGLYNRLDRRSEQWPVMDRLVKARPNDFTTTVRAIQAALAAGIDLQQVEVLAARARRLAADGASPPDSEGSVVLDFLPAFEAWLKDDVPATIRLAEETAARSRHHAKFGTLFEIALGRLAAAEKFVAQEERYSTDNCTRCGSDREGDLALVAFFRGNRAPLASHLAAAQKDYGRQLTLVVWLSLQVDTQKGERFFSEWSARPDDGHSPPATSPWAASVRAELRLARGDRAALDALEQAVRAVDQRRYLRGSEVLADALIEHGDLARGAAVLEEASRVRTRVFTAPPLAGEVFGGVFWLRLRAKLARVYRRMGRVEEADRIDAEVSTLLARADPDFKLFP